MPPDPLLLASGGAGSGFQTGTPATPSAATKALYGPNFTAGPTGKHPCAPWVTAILENLVYCVNGVDNNWFWDGATTSYDMGSTVPTTFAVAVTGASGWLANGATADYYCVFRNVDAAVGDGTQTILKETSFQEVSVTNSSGGTRNVSVSWTAPTAGTTNAQFTDVGIYRKLQSAGTAGAYKLVAEVAVGSSPYTDSTTDATLATSLNSYIERKRTTLPPVAKGIVSHLNRAWIWTGADSTLRYSQVSRTDGHAVTDDFPSGNAKQVEPHDGDVITACASRFGELLVFKRRGCYALEGVNPAALTPRTYFTDRGCLSARSLIEVNGIYYFLDERGLMATDLVGVPIVVGAEEVGQQESPLQPIWNRLNLDCADLFQLIHDEARGLIRCVVCLDFSPTPIEIPAFDYRLNRFVTIDDGVPWYGAGYLDDASGLQHLCVLDELNVLWETDAGDAEGVYTGDTRGTVDSTGALQQATDSTAAFDAGDAYASPYERANSAGTIVDEGNRVWLASGTAITPLYWSSTAPATNDRIDIGVVPFVLDSVDTDFNIPEDKRMYDLRLLTDVEADGTLAVYSAVDENTLALMREVDLSALDGFHVVDLDAAIGFKWRFRLQARYAGDDLAVKRAHVRVQPLAGTRYL